MSSDSEETEVTDCEDVCCDENYQDKTITGDDDDKDEDEIGVSMTTPSGGAPYLCPNCDYKATIDVIYDNHRQSHTDYTASDHSD